MQVLYIINGSVFQLGFVLCNQHIPMTEIVTSIGRKHVHQTAQFGKLEIIASCMIFQIDPIRQFCTKHVPMTQYAIIISTSTTPSCGGPLRAQIFRKVCFYEQKQDFWPIIRKVCFYEQKQDFWPIRTRFDPLKGPPNSYFFNIFFQT